MHRYEHAVGEENPWLSVEIGSFRFNDAQDLVSLARVDRTIGWMTWPERGSSHDASSRVPNGVGLAHREDPGSRLSVVIRA